jgi:hypothetical protein
MLTNIINNKGQNIMKKPGRYTHQNTSMFGANSERIEGINNCFTMIADFSIHI